MGRTKDTLEEQLKEWEHSADTQIRMALKEGDITEIKELEAREEEILKECLELERLLNLSDEELFEAMERRGVDPSKVRGSC